MGYFKNDVVLTLSDHWKWNIQYGDWKI